VTSMQITLDDIEAHAPDVLLPPDEEFAEEYAEEVAFGREIARDSTVAFVAICRNACPFLPRTLDLVEETAARFRDWSCYIHENDSVDDTKQILGRWQDGERRHASLNTNGRPHLNYTTSTERTHALAEYRSACQQFVRNGEPPEYVVVFDTDPWGGWSIDGLMTSIAYLVESQGVASCLASYSWAEVPGPRGPAAIHYDAFALRHNHWRRRDQQWIHHWHPPVGSPPVPMNSAFGQLAIYRRDAYLAMRYSGEDCEHVCAHRTMPGRLYLNPSSRCVSFWVPRDGQHRDD
jgi:hypothetical protein